jgi:hypothetical protein
VAKTAKNVDKVVTNVVRAEIHVEMDAQMVQHVTQSVTTAIKKVIMHEIVIKNNVMRLKISSTHFNSSLQTLTKACTT